MRIRRKHIISGILGLILLIFSYQLWKNRMLIFPYNHLTHSATYHQFKVYSDLELPDHFDNVLEEVANRLTGTLEFGKHTYKIFLCQSPKLFTTFSEQLGMERDVQGFNLLPLNYIFINDSFIETIRQRNTSNYKYNILEGNKAHIIAHEIVHQLIAKKVGYLQSRKLETWKKEGLCEYYASNHLKKEDQAYRLENLIQQYWSGEFENIPQGQKLYIESLIATEYIIDKKGYTFNRIINEDLNRSQLLEQIKLKYFLPKKQTEK